MPEIAELFPKSFLERQGATPEAVQSRIGRASALLDTRLEAVPESAFYNPTAPEKWSPAEIADHVIRVNRLIAQALQIGLRRTTDPDLVILRMPRGHVTPEGNTIAPDGTEPAPGRDRDALKTELEAGFADISLLAHDLNTADGLNITCVDQSFFGEMNARECLQLIAWHTAHHARQLPEG